MCTQLAAKKAKPRAPKSIYINPLEDFLERSRSSDKDLENLAKENAESRSVGIRELEDKIEETESYLEAYPDHEGLSADLERYRRALQNYDRDHLTTIEAARAQEKARLEARLEAWKRARDEHINKSLHYPETLYDMDPKKFADMPTKDFMELVKELVRLTGNVDSRKKQNDAFNSIKQTLVTDLGNQVDSTEDRDYLSSIQKELLYYYLGHEGRGSTWGKAERAVKKEIDGVLRTDWFDKSPRQRMEGILGVVNQRLEVTSEELQSAIEQHQAFLDKFKPDAEDAKPDEPKPKTKPAEA